MSSYCGLELLFRKDCEGIWAVIKELKTHDQGKTSVVLMFEDQIRSVNNQHLTL